MSKSEQIKKETTTLGENHKFQAKPAVMPLFVSVKESFSLLFKIITQYSQTKKKKKNTDKENSKTN
jgi:hypothetical protein